MLLCEPLLPVSIVPTRVPAVDLGTDLQLSTH
jgi:hypothetical protein